MELKIIHPLLESIKKEQISSAEDISAANLSAFLLLTGPYLKNESYHLAEIGPGDIRLFQTTPRNDIVDNDPMMAFYIDDFYEYYDDGVENTHPEIYEVEKIRAQHAPKRIELRDIPDTIHQRANELLVKTERLFPGFTSRLLRPTQDQLKARNNLTIKTVPFNEFHNVVSNVMGERYDCDLASQGIKYHNDRYGDEGYFIIAHNKDEIAGLIKMSMFDTYSYSMQYVSVNPAFQHKGLSKKLFQRAIDLCEEHDKALKRSSSGGFTRDNPNITVSYDNLLRKSSILHGHSDHPIMYVIEQIKAQGSIPEAIMTRLKKACDDATPSEETRLSGEYIGTTQMLDEIPKNRQLLNDLLAMKKTKPLKIRP